MDTETEMKVIAESHHRNGVCGEGFSVRIVEEYDRRMLVVTFDSDSMRTAVFDIDLLQKNDVEFGSNSWRGDQYAWDLGL